MRRITLIVIAAGVVGFLFIQDIQLDRQLSIRTDFSGATPYFSALGPPTRVEREGEANRFFAEPVYFDLRLPRWFSEAEVKFRWRADDLPDPKIGVALEPSDDNIQGRFTLFDTKRVSEEDGFVVSETTLPIASLPRTRYGVRVFFSVPGVSREIPFFVESVVVVARRKSLIEELRRIL